MKKITKLRTVEDTVRMLHTVCEAVDMRLERMRNEGADTDRLARERRRRELLVETLKAVQETGASACAN
ncbi:MAG: hypothetical protein HS116_27865 [Planctomycetes bacterium]|nr:hypothetical protein [Planctomycetota bacterium]